MEKNRSNLQERRHLAPIVCVVFLFCVSCVGHEDKSNDGITIDSVAMFQLQNLKDLRCSTDSAIWGHSMNNDELAIGSVAMIDASFEMVDAKYRKLAYKISYDRLRKDSLFEWLKKEHPDAFIPLQTYRIITGAQRLNDSDYYRWSEMKQVMNE